MDPYTGTETQPLLGHDAATFVTPFAGSPEPKLNSKLEEASSTPYTDVPGFYKDASIFVTGITGFLGKAILEKLLRSCPEIKNVFVLVRNKKGHNPSERVDALFDCKLFDRVQTDYPNAKSKVIPIAGDMLADGLGISEEDIERMVAAQVSVVIHSAATIRFDEPLRLALNLNVAGTQKVVRLCRNFPQLKALVHVSTAYANCDLTYINEQVYPPPVDPHKLLDALDWMTDEAAGKLTPVLLGDKPNTYTYTKHLAESLLVKEAGDDLPYIIVRPSIVGASWKEPFPGWIDNFNGPSGLFIACGMGLLRSMIGKPDAIADIVPVDTVSNVIIAAPWYRALHIDSAQSDSPPILNICSGAYKPLRWGELKVVLHAMRTKYPLKNAIRYPNAEWTQNSNNNSPPALAPAVQLSSKLSSPSTSSLSSCESSESQSQPAPLNPPDSLVINCTSGYIPEPLKWTNVGKLVSQAYIKTPLQRALRYPVFYFHDSRLVYFMWAMMSHKLPAIIMDTYMRLIGRKPRVLSMYRKLHRSMDTLSFFTQRHWEWQVGALSALQGALGPQGNKDFNTSVRDISWPEYLDNFCIGAKCFVLNEELSDLHIAKKRMTKLKTLHYVFNILSAAIVWKVIALRSEVAAKLWNAVVQFIFKWMEALRLTRFVTL